VLSTDSPTNKLDFAVQEFELFCRVFIHIFIEERYCFWAVRGFTIPMLKYSIESSWMDDLIGRSESKSEEIRDGDGWNCPHCLNEGNNFFSTVSRFNGHKKLIFWSNNAHTFTIFVRLANEGNIE
jgi:hypothetical protein